MPPLRILVADDHYVIRVGVRTVLEERSEWKICGEVATGAAAIERTEALKPDVLILDISLPDMSGLEVAKRILSSSSRVEVLMLSVHASETLIRECIKAGARGYVVKSDSVQDLVAAVETIAKHQPFFTPSASAVILSNYHLDGPVTEVSEMIRGRLTSREKEIVQLLAEGKSSRKIASDLGISYKTAENHRTNIRRKLGVHNLTQLVRYAVRNQIITP
jgi:DNA-binding NarL/FixJ family response regulator